MWFHIGAVAIFQDVNHKTIASKGGKMYVTQPDGCNGKAPRFASPVNYQLGWGRDFVRFTIPYYHAWLDVTAMTYDDLIPTPNHDGY